ncbi:MAG: hypothetical protein IJI73_11620 [Kiritimatiellae bacterium]|nr:hypothetical protein [Kiritimatiellia bacterium]
MLVGVAGVLIASAGFLTEVPPSLAARLAPTNETSGVFVQVKRLPTGEAFESKGTFRIRPGADFEWRTLEPFDALFRATRTEYVYSNEDEVVSRPLRDLPGHSSFSAFAEGDFSAALKAFDTLYKEDESGFHLLSRPKAQRLKKLLSRVDVDGDATNMTMRAELPDRSTFTVTTQIRSSGT